jgi:hypothetical protein
VERKNMRDVNVEEWRKRKIEVERKRCEMRVKDLERKKRECEERGKKGERERETYKRIQCMKKKGQDE